jgi:hypothetical protein
MIVYFFLINSWPMENRPEKMNELASPGVEADRTAELPLFQGQLRLLNYEGSGDTQ